MENNRMIPVTIREYREIAGKKVPIVSSLLSLGDQAGAVMARLGFQRDLYRVTPGLYGIGSPDKLSPVMVTANYKLTFDSLRKELDGIDAWILVLDTRGINVWCAAGKGTFGTKELVSRVISTELFKVVSHKDLIVPQLGAVGVAAHQVTSFTKFRVHYGPVRASDIKEYLKSGMKKTDEMRKVNFNLIDRAKVIPVEIVSSWFVHPILFGFFLALDLIFHHELSLQWVSRSFIASLPFMGAVLAGCALVPLLLPWIPFRAFSMKGWLLGTLLFIPVLILGHLTVLSGLAGYLMFVPLVSFFAMNFTGSSTFTNLHGAEMEVRAGTPVMIAGLAAGALLKTLISLKIIV